MTPKPSRREQVHARILEVCETLFRARGFEASSIDDIAAGADISRQTFFNYFSGKDAVLSALAVAWLGRQAALPQLDPASAGSRSVLGEARRFVLAQAQAIEADRDFMTLVIFHAGPAAPRGGSGGADSRRQRSDSARDIFSGLAEILRAGQASGEVRSGVDPLRLAEVYVSAVLMTIQLWLLEPAPGGESLERRVNTAVDVLEGGLRAGQGR